MSAVASDATPLNFYRPDYFVKTPTMRSPDYVQLSTAAAITLGLIPGVMHRTSCTHCLNLLMTYPEGCRANCTYCGLARHREESRDYADRNFIRVDWPTVRVDEMLERIAANGDKGQFERMCISMITHPDSDHDTQVVLKRWMEAAPHIPVSILSNPTTMEKQDLIDLKNLGADIFTVALDAVTPAIFERTRGKTVQSPHSWDKYWQAIEWAAEIYGPEKFGAHLICGMGETEQEILEVCQRIKDMGGHNHMFAFFPEKGSMMEDWDAVPQDHWRRVQLGRFLIDYAGGRYEDMSFDAYGRVEDFGYPQAELEDIINSGKPFQTSGCPGKDDEEVSACNRPYGDSSPSDIRSFPFALNKQDVEVVRRQMRLRDLRVD
ncbi:MULTISPECIES: radical SAM protein [Acidithiobacillus]|jgi:biotin synthase-related radical SAM superfamily protein|uniref:Radical SAM domain protein n=2 Tax=Acidithiobacillus caldus TaxID=33059 RepID=A0A060A1M4_ACICK|nr:MULTISPECIES: radical SAM protein [Acidithiobacillus]AIA56037.1 Radical SAM domain protein [Acidithiobacillus caldus ATCC 51756]MBU2730700.1 radical SAM protein [Acidithiobacillus caldus]MBU2736142.1 radical SAM protein [Acidithiobacillus caldus ATCC 51756]MBU2745482.1 radical SAM protein [Acidithiobacillus caldus]MBU2762963.1 radical SAM protein [Acidithiobacillus caldus]